MKKTEKSFNKIKKWCLKPLRSLLLSVVILPVIMLTLLHLPIVQQQLLCSISDYLYKTTHYQIKCNTFRLNWLRHITLEGITVLDPQNQLLFTVHTCKSKLNILSLLLLKPDIIRSFSVTGGQIYLEKNINQSFNLDKFYTKVILPFIPEVNKDIYIHTIQLHCINLHYHDQVSKQKFKLKNIELGIKYFLSSTANHSGDVTTFSYQETNDLPLTLKNLMTKFNITPYSIVLKDCHLTTKYSNLQGDLTLKHIKQLPLVTKKDEISLEAILHKTVLSSIELSMFSDWFQGEHTLYMLDGIVSLTLQTIEWKNCKLVFGDSYIKSTGCYNGIDIDVSVPAGIVYAYDLQKKPAVYPTTLQYIGITNATLVGNTQKVNLTGEITTNLGVIQTNLMLHHLGKPRQNLTGKITLHNIAIEAILPTLPIRSLSGTVVVQAPGTRLNTLDAVANLTEIKTDHYNYKQIDVSCIVSNNMATFKLHSKDPNVKLTATGSYHMGKSLQTDGVIEQVHLEKIGFVLTPLFLSTKFSFIIRNISSKRPQGKIILNQCIVQSLAKKVACEHITIHTIKDGNKDIITLSSPLIDCRLQGSFTIYDLVYHIKYLITRLNNPDDRGNIPATFYLNYVISCKGILPILKWVLDDVYISVTPIFLGHISYDTDYHFSLHLTPSTFCFKQFSLENIKLKLNVNHLMDHKKRLIQLYISSDKQDWNQLFQTEHLYLQLLLDQNTFTISNKLSSHHNHLSISCSGRLTDNSIQVDLKPSKLITKRKIWTIQTDSTSCISKSGITIGNLSITHGQESICIGGKLTPSETTDPLHCTIRYLTLNYASAIGPVKGIIDTKLVTHFQKDRLIATGRLILKDATIQDYTIGTLCTNIDWNILENTLALSGILQKEDQKFLQINGYYYLIKPSDNLSITTTFHQMELGILNPFFESICSDISGTLSGQFQLTGSLTAPKIHGKGTIDKGAFKINYLNTCYQVTGHIKFRENCLYIDELHLSDGTFGRATLSGHIMIQNGFPVVLSGRMKALHLLHTNRMHNSDFYGDLYATGTLQIEGSIDNLLLKIKATTDKGTFTIIAHDKEDIENTTKLVQFVSSKGKKQLNKASNHKSRPTIKLILDLIILPTIKTQVLFVSYNNMNDILQGQGTGAIQLEVGTNRKPYVMGNYLFQNGTYTISVYNIIQKTFTIIPNSQINFNGYPQEGIAHIDASYRQTASIVELYPKSNDKRPIPVEITLSAYGTLANPHIAYQLSFPVKSMDFELNTALEECASKALLNKHYLNKQILSLLITKRVYNEKKIDGWDALSNSINDFLAQRIQSIVSKINHNLEIETDLGINQSNHQNIFQKTSIKVSYLLLSEHLKLSSTVGRNSRFINDWEIAYRISNVHHMHAKLYQQPLKNEWTNLSLFGISFSYTKKFW